jgi:hypothetical protein
MEEWGVKGYLTSERAAAARTGAPASGTDYLLRKRQARDAAESAHEAADALVAGIHQDLARRAGAAVLSRPQDRRLSGHDGDMVLNASYLVPAAEVDAFTALVEELGELHRGSGVQLECTGPWPPYHFVDRA